MDYYAHSLETADKACWQPLKDHLIAVADQARSFASSFGAGELGWAAGILHDVGKASKDFQLRLEDPRLRVDHSSAGARIAAEEYGPLGLVIAYAVAGHHGGIPDGGNKAAEGSLIHRLTTKDVPDCSDYARKLGVPPPPPRLTIRPQPGHPGFGVAFFIRMLFSCLVDADFLDTERFMDPVRHKMRPRSPKVTELHCRLERYLRQKTAGAPDTRVNRIRAEVLQACIAAAQSEPGLFTLTVPTGGGKTLSSLAFALRHAVMHGLDRVIYVIPFTSIIEQNAAVFREAVGADAVLEHHSNVVRHQEGEDSGLVRRLELAEENWDMPLVVTTNVQFFESLFSNRSSRCRKLHNVAKSVVILDEAQMLPVELLQPCVAALAELVTNYRATVLLCSATQPALGGLLPADIKVKEIVPDPSSLYNALKRVVVSNGGKLENDEVAAEILSRKQALCIVNTRAHARRLFERLGENDGHYHLSAAMCPVHRAQRLGEIRERLRSAMPCRVISTQLVEAGVDLDFPVVMRAMAGIDSIAQAAGRCNREGLRDRGEVIVFWPAGGEGMRHVWFKRTAAIAARIVEASNDPLALEAVERYFQDLYFYEGARLDEREIMQRLEAGAKSLNFPFDEIARLFRVIAEDTFSISIPFDDECKRAIAQARAEGIDRALARRIQPYTVSIQVWEYKQLWDSGALENIGGVDVLRDMSFYDSRYGLHVPAPKERGDACWIV
ncbi:MAG: CRISPR-associated helicase Cas3' [Firmicutes bacterium]|jgi:CRISPR-associated helicase Cas3/CRISPR-associated endonuclease Cas3-HD|nr:CRISPR-associated helicase Cas3' [Bacillota bacterium]MDH7495883.1 CRISPR-associated helicase Cas3' [Bacillota bacterium]